MNKRIAFVLLSALFLSCSTPEQRGAETVEEERYRTLRESMVREQIVARGIKDRLVIAAMKKVPRHQFIPAKLRELAYADGPLPIGEGQTISQPYIVALMTELLKLGGGERVLEIGTGSGYQAAILAEIAKEVYTIEILEPLATTAGKRLKDMGYENITVRCGDGYQGWEERAPFDGVLVTCAPDHIPQPLLDQLNTGGRMVIPVGDEWQELVLLEKTEKGVRRESIIPVRFVPMTGEAEEEKGR